jgi:hypothetical protein
LDTINPVIVWIIVQPVTREREREKSKTKRQMNTQSESLTHRQVRVRVMVIVIIRPYHFLLAKGSPIRNLTNITYKPKKDIPRQNTTKKEMTNTRKIEDNYKTTKIQVKKRLN